MPNIDDVFFIYLRAYTNSVLGKDTRFLLDPILVIGYAFINFQVKYLFERAVFRKHSSLPPSMMLQKKITYFSIYIYDSTDLADFYCIRYCQDKVCIFGKSTIFFYKKESSFFYTLAYLEKYSTDFSTFSLINWPSLEKF